MLASNLSVNIFADQMNGLDFFFPAPAAVSASATAAGNASVSATVGGNEEDDDWGDFVDSSVAASPAGSLPPDPNGFFADRINTGSLEVAQPDSALSRIESSQAQWVKPRGPVPLSVFGEEEEEEEGKGDESGPSVPSLKFAFDSFSSKHNNGNGSVNKVVNMNPSAGISGLIANLCRDNGQNEPKKGLNSLSENNSGNFGMSGKNLQWNSLYLDGNILRSGSAEVPVKVGSSDLSQKVPDSVVSLESLSWNPLNFDSERFEPKSNTMNSNTREVMFDLNGSNSGSVAQNDDIDEDDGWEFKAAESISQTGDVDSKAEEQKKAESGFVAVSNSTDLSWNFWSLPTNGRGSNVDTGKTDAVNSVSDSGDGDDDSWGNDGWEFKVAEPGEPKNHISSKVEGNEKKDVKRAEFTGALQNSVHQDDDLFAVSSQQSGGWGFAFEFNPAPKTETTTYSNSNSQSQQCGRENIPSFFPSDSEETAWAFKQSSSETGTHEEKLGVANSLPATFQTHISDGVIQKKEVLSEKPKGPLALSLFGEEDLESSDHVVHEDIPPPIHDSSSRDKPKTPGPSISISDLISGLYNQVEEKTTIDLTEKCHENGFGSIMAVTDSNSVCVEDDSWEFQGPTQSTSHSGLEKPDDVNDDSWEFQGPIETTTESAVGDEVDEFGEDSWEFQGPIQPVEDSNLKKGDQSSWEFQGGFLGNKAESQSSAPASVGEQHETPVINIELNDFRDLFDKLKTELCYIALSHLENLKELQRAHSLAADSGEGTEAEKSDEEIQDLKKRLDEDVLISEINLESLQPRSSGISEFTKALEQPKFQALDLEYRLSERLLLAQKDWKSMIDLLKHATLTLKILNLGSAEQQSSYTLTWSSIASACAQELRHAVSIWRQAREKNVQKEILSESQGKNYILALGEIYRTAKTLQASTRIYKPWILLAPGLNVLALLDECASLWSSSGLEEALLNISDISGLQSDESAAHLLESIKQIDELDAFTLHNHIISAREPTCHISGLTPETIPGMKAVEWDRERYLVALANLWANLISRDPPSLPHALLGNQSFTTTASLPP